MAARVALYGTLVTPAGNEVVVTLSGARAMVMVNCAVAVRGLDSLSATWTVKVEVPLAVGVPETPPALLKLRPAGKLPEATLHV